MFIYVNWAEVLRNPPVDCVLQNLCSCDPEYLSGIFGFDRYKKFFTRDYPKVPELGVLLNNLKKAIDVKQELDKFLKEYPVPYFLLEFEGQYNGTCSGVPSWSDITSKRFYQTTKMVGSSVQFRDIDWVVLYSRISDDRAIKPFVSYIFIMMPYAVFQLQPTYTSCFEFEGEFIETIR